MARHVEITGMTRNALEEYVHRLETLAACPLERKCQRCDRFGYVNDTGYCSTRCEMGFPPEPGND